MNNLLVLTKEAVDALKAEAYAKGYADAEAEAKKKTKKKSKAEITVDDETYEVRNAVVE